MKGYLDEKYVGKLLPSWKKQLCTLAGGKLKMGCVRGTTRARVSTARTHTHTCARARRARSDLDLSLGGAMFSEIAKEGNETKPRVRGLAHASVVARRRGCRARRTQFVVRATLEREGQKTWTMRTESLWLRTLWITMLRAAAAKVAATTVVEEVAAATARVDAPEGAEGVAAAAPRVDAPGPGFGVPDGAGGVLVDAAAVVVVPGEDIVPAVVAAAGTVVRDCSCAARATTGGRAGWMGLAVLACGAIAAARVLEATVPFVGPVIRSILLVLRACEAVKVCARCLGALLRWLRENGVWRSQVNQIECREVVIRLQVCAGEWACVRLATPRSARARCRNSSNRLGN